MTFLSAKNDQRSFIKYPMKMTLLFLLVCLANQLFGAQIKDKVIYGQDDRRPIADLIDNDPEDLKMLNWSRSVLAQIPHWRVGEFLSDSYSVETKDLVSGLNVCSDEKFLNMPLVSSCSAFLVAPDLIMTAGHCLKDKYDCKKQSWVFDYDDSKNFSPPEGHITFKMKDSVYCQELLAHVVNPKADYALIKINRPILDRQPLALRREGKVGVKDSLVVIGHPLGMPKKISTNISIRENLKPTLFKTNADTFSGNSGSPVINAKTGLVEGVLIRGEEDFIDVIELGCKRSKNGLGSECRGESVGRSTSFPLKYIPK